VVRNEFQAQQGDQTRWRYVSREQQRGIDQTKEVIETSEGALSRIVAEDNQNAYVSATATRRSAPAAAHSESN